MFKSVLVVVTNPGRAKAAISAGAAIALANQGHLDVLALGIDHVQMGLSYIEAGSILSNLDLALAETEAKAATAAARTALGELDPSLLWALDTAVAEPGGVSTVVGTAAGFADLVVQCRPYGEDQGPQAEAVVEAALFDARASVLILPDTAVAATLAKPRRILLAWDQSAQALTAAKRALPWLRGADIVDVTVVDPPSHGPERSDPGGMLCQFLVRHGVRVQITVLARTRPSTAAVLADHAMDRGADIMVMGAYGHSRLREALLGGTTREVLENTAIPVLMAH